jgi:hypothetical protein
VRYFLLLAFALVGCTSTVLIHSLPEGATVSVDGKPVGVTPCKVEASTGEPIWVRLDGYYPRQFFLKEIKEEIVYMGSYGTYGGGSHVQDTYSIKLEPDPDAKK